jgi:hypothetical protein
MGQADPQVTEPPPLPVRAVALLAFLAQLLTETRDSADVRGAICVSRRRIEWET